MTSPALSWNVVRVLEQGIACLQSELPGVLATLAAEHGMTLPPPISWWRSDEIPTDWDSPGVGLYDVSTVYESADALNAYDAIHTLSARLVIAASSADADDLSDYDDAIRAYAWGVAYTLQLHLSSAAYGRPFGVWDCVPVDTTPTTLVEATDRGQFLRFIDIRWQVRQRVKRVAP